MLFVRARRAQVPGLSGAAEEEETRVIIISSPNTHAYSLQGIIIVIVIDMGLFRNEYSMLLVRQRDSLTL